MHNGGNMNYLNSKKKSLPFVSFSFTCIILSFFLLFADHVLAEQSGSSNETGATSKILTLYNELTSLSHGSSSDTPDWGSVWNTIKTAAKWQPDGDALTSDVLDGKTFYSGNSRTAKTGTMVARSLSDLSTIVSAGYYNATTLSSVDTDFIDDNIKQGINIFGVVGNYEGESVPGLPLTGQTTVYETGDDGTYQRGVANTFTDNGDGTVTDSRGLIWPKAWNGDAANGGAKFVSWEAAVQYCYNGTFFGSSDWRLPNIRELNSVVDKTKLSPATFSIFTNVASDVYWSSTSGGAQPISYAWYILMVQGAQEVMGKGMSNYGVCVQ
jgi:hypothetical protein